MYVSNTMEETTMFYSYNKHMPESKKQQQQEMFGSEPGIKDGPSITQEEHIIKCAV